jgi:transketolase
MGAAAHGSRDEQVVMTDPNTLAELRARALRIRAHIVDMCAGPEGGHLGGSMSAVEILTALYFHVMRTGPDLADDPDRDIFLLSKGHGAIALYATLAERGFISEAELSGYATAGSRLMGHPTRAVPGVEMPTGSLGHGLALTIGFALDGRLRGSSRRCFVLMGDGEQQEGSVWEGAMGAVALRLDQMVGIVDRNRLQQSGRTEDITPLDGLGKRWNTFGWAVREVDGQDVGAVADALRDAPWQSGRPSMLICHTTKGAGVPFLADRVQSHYVRLSERQHARARSALYRAARGETPTSSSVQKG